ncbi:MAG: serine hydrolase [Candidatus Levybacteria bacterium]|nr:serine hydrolase [Candidatus Levybacteria bacterium]
MKKKVFLLLFIFVTLINVIGFYIFNQIIFNSNLHKTISNSLSGAKGKYSVAVEDLKNGKKESLYGDKVFAVGSLYKLWVMAEAHRQIQEGLLSKDEVLSEEVSVLNKDFNIDPESAELTKGVITLTVRDALKQMITISHNYAALLLTKKIKLSNVANFLEINGFKNSHVGNVPTSTADNIATFFEKLYKGELANAQYTNEMLALLKAQSLNNKLPKYLPKGTVIAHKTGEIDYLSHDAGIVYAKNRDYVIVVLSESDYPPGAEERISQISKSVFDYFTK